MLSLSLLTAPQEKCSTFASRNLELLKILSSVLIVCEIKFVTVDAQVCLRELGNELNS